jgi:hypothetical protein
MIHHYRDKVVGVFVRFSCAASAAALGHDSNPKLPKPTLSTFTHPRRYRPQLRRPLPRPRDLLLLVGLLLDRHVGLLLAQVNQEFMNSRYLCTGSLASTPARTRASSCGANGGRWGVGRVDEVAVSGNRTCNTTRVATRSRQARQAGDGRRRPDRRTGEQTKTGRQGWRTL